MRNEIYFFCQISAIVFLNSFYWNISATNNKGILYFQKWIIFTEINQEIESTIYVYTVEGPGLRSKYFFVFSLICLAISLDGDYISK